MVGSFDLLQVHNLNGWEEHLPYLFEMKRAGHLRYVGVTTSHGRRTTEMAQIVRSQPLDFVQVTYNIRDRELERRLLPLAHERGIAVIINRPFREGALLEQLTGRPLPAWAHEIDCTGWPHVLLVMRAPFPARATRQ